MKAWVRFNYQVLPFSMIIVIIILLVLQTSCSYQSQAILFANAQRECFQISRRRERLTLTIINRFYHFLGYFMPLLLVTLPFKSFVTVFCYYYYDKLNTVQQTFPNTCDLNHSNHPTWLSFSSILLTSKVLCPFVYFYELHEMGGSLEKLEKK